MDLTGLKLVVPDKADRERDAVCRAWSDVGGAVLRLARFWEPPDGLNPKAIRLYGNDTFCLVVAQKLSLSLISPPDEFPLRIDPHWWRREVDIVPLAEARAGAFPRFVKPITPKQFAARVYDSSRDLDQECRGLGSGTSVLRSSVVSFEAEARAFVLDGAILDCAIYDGSADARHAADFACSFAEANSLPPTCVVDVGLVSGGGWAFVEANASWGAGLNGCDAARVLPAIEHATRTAEQHAGQVSSEAAPSASPNEPSA